jgi:hypothetical protein
MQQQQMAGRLGYATVPALKRAVALAIRAYVAGGGFLFAMCSATDALDIALAGAKVDIVATPFDGTPPDPGVNDKLDYSATLAFTDFTLITDPLIYEYSDIDTPLRIDRVCAAPRQTFLPSSIFPLNGIPFRPC